MKKIFLSITLALIMPMTLFSQTYTSLWKQVSDAEQKDLPQTEQQVLGQIIEKAAREKAYGQLLKAELQQARALSQVAPDSLEPAVGRLRQRLDDSTDEPLRAVYNAVLGSLYERLPQLSPDDHQQQAARYYDAAMAHPEALAAVKATDYVPFVVSGSDSRFFGDDLLSVVGYETRRFALLHRYYTKAGNRRAALLAGVEMLRQEQPAEMEPLNKSAHLQRIDSLIAEYQDLQECGEAAIARYEFMDDHTDATAEQMWQYVNYAIDRWPSWQRMNMLRNRQRDLTAQRFSAVFSELSIPQQPQTISLEGLRGVGQLTMRVYSVKTDGDTNLSPDNSNDYKKLKPLLTPLQHLTQTRTYMGKQPYEMYEDSIVLPGLPAGVYMIEMETQPQTQTSRRLYFVSDVRVLTIGMPKKQVRYVVVNATTGQPVKGASLRLSTYQGYRHPKTVQTLTTDQQGEVLYSYDRERPTEVFAYTASDRFCPPANAYGYYGYHENKNTVHNAFVYTDRQIYRPGQTVHVAAIFYKTDEGYKSSVEAGKNVTFELRDANYQVVASADAVADEYGTCATDFVLPQQGLSGLFSVRANSATQHFRVEEYKRPSFEVEMPPVSQNYEDGDTVVAVGSVRSYAGVPVQGARVKYKVVRRLAFWWMNYSRYWNQGFYGSANADEQVASGETFTGADGSFGIDVPMVLPKTKHTMFYNFVVTADVTDQAGETHQGVLTLPLGNRRTALTATMPEKVLAEQDTKMAFHCQNAAGVDLDATVRYRFDGGKWQEQKTNTLFLIPQMKSGRHTLHAVCEGDSLEQQFTVFSLDDKRPAAETDDWFFVSAQQFPNDGTPVTMQVGSSEKNVHIVYAIFAGERVVESGAIDRSNELLNRKLTYDDSMGGGLLLTFAWAKNGKVYTHAATIKRPTPDKHLQLKWTTFRNRLQPGQKEEWTLSVLSPSGEKLTAPAQLLATLYDKSLDQLVPQEWSIVPYENLPLPSTHWTYEDRGMSVLQGYRHQGALAVSDLKLSAFDHDVYPFTYSRFGRMRMLKTASRNIATSAGMVADEAVEMKAVSEDAMLAAAPQAANDALMDKATAYEAVEAEESADGGAEQPLQMRENLQETAFFMPQLTTDADGNVALKFTLPESLTTWRFLGVAHTQDMMYGMLTDEAVARKAVMIQPNMPRFVRMGDRATIAARIFNTGEQTVSGTARLVLLDAETEKVIAQSAAPVSVAPDSTVSVSFTCQPRQSWPSLLVARISVGGKTFSDGEQHYLPVLPDREHVTVTVPFTQNEPGTKVINLESLLPADTQRQSLTIEYTNNPAWLMIQALPAVGHPHDDCAVCQAASLYANTIGRHILDQNPTAKHVFEMWKQEEQRTAAGTSLSSQLEKNQELKSLLLTETPWVMDAQRETEQRHRLADFFDANLMQQRLATAADKLTKLQNGDGSWSWWPGMRGSSWMTIEVAQMLVRLNEMTGQQEATRQMLDRAFAFIGKETVEMVDEMKRQERKGHKQVFPSFKALQWLYLATIDGRQLPAKVQEANTYLKNLLKKETKNQTILEKALSAIVLNNQTYIKSLKEYTVFKEEMGRYYDTQRAGYSWRDYRIPTQVAAIEALKRLSPKDTQTIEEMQRWLLQEKRTQAWDTPLNSADAIYAFLNGNQQVLAPQEKTVLRVNGRQLDTSDATAGIGYVKQAVAIEGAKTFTAEKTSTGTSWGAVYAQFMQSAADITDQESGISVKREVFAARSGKRGDDAQWAMVDGQPLNVGDRVKVRITLLADRDYDFVQVIDKRAACLEPVNQLSGYGRGYYCTPRDYTTNFYFDCLPKGRHVIETEYYIDRSGTYETGTCTAECAYSPEYRGLTKSLTIEVK